MALQRLPVALGNGKTVLWDWKTELARRTLEGYRIFEMQGYDSAIIPSTGTVTMGDKAGSIVYPSTAQVCQVVSTNANDDVANTTLDGAQQINIQGADDDGNFVFENVDMNGTTNVPTVNSYKRITSMRVNNTATDDLANAGKITVTHPDGLLNQMEAEVGRQNVSTMFLWKGYRWYYQNLVVSTTGTFRLDLQQKTSGRGWISENFIVVTAGTHPIDISQWIGKMGSNRDTRIRCENIGTGSQTISLHAEILQISDLVSSNE